MRKGEMRNGNEEMRNGNEVMRLSMEKLVHASQTNTCNSSLAAPLVDSTELYDSHKLGHRSGLTWAVKTELSDRPLDGDSDSDGSSDNSGQLKNTIRADI